MVSELVIVGLVVILGSYWFRYNCRAILRTQASGDRAQQVASANQLIFADVDAYLATELSAADLDTLNDLLRRDYKVLTCLLRYTAIPGSIFTVEQRMLMADFRLMQWIYVLTRLYMHGPARHSLAERSKILSHFAATLSERSAAVVRT
jgi:hypothetical protein